MTRSHLFTTIVCMAISLPFCGSALAQEKKVNLPKASAAAIRQYNIGANAQNKQDFKFAAKSYETFLKDFPANDKTPVVHYYAGVCYKQLQQYENAIQHYKTVTEKYLNAASFSNQQEVYLDLGWCQFQKARLEKDAAKQKTLFDEAAKTFAALLKTYPTSKYEDQALYFQAESLYLQGKKKESIAPYTKLVTKFDEKSSVHMNGTYALGVTHEELGQYADAGKIYDIFIAKYAKNSLITEVKMRKAECVLRTAIAATGDAKKTGVEDALKRFKEVEAVQGFGLKYHAVYREGECYVELGQFVEAGKTYGRVATEFPSCQYAKESTLFAGRNYYNGESYDEALTWFEKVIAADKPNACEAAHWICRIYHRKGDFAKAHDTAVKTLPLPDSAKSKYFVNLKMDQADALYETPDRKAESLPLYLKIVADHASHELAPQALYNAAFTAMELGKYPEAIQHAQKFVGAYKDHERLPDTKYVLAECNLLTKKYPEAEAIYKDLTANHKTHPDLERWQVRMALSMFLQNKFQDAIDTLTPAIQPMKVPANKAEGQLIVGKSQFQLNKFTEAESALTSSVAADPKWTGHDETLLYLSQSLHKIGKTPDAINKAKQMLGDFPESNYTGQMLYRYGEFCYASEEYDQAITNYTLVTDKHADSMYAPYAFYGKGWSQIKKNEFDAANATFDAMIKKYTDHMLKADAQFARGLCRRQTKDYKNAVSDFAEFLKTDPKKADKCNANYEKGLAEMELKDYAAAVGSFGEVLKVDPKCAVADKATYELAWAYKSSDKKEEAIATFRKLHADFPNSSYAGEAHFHDGEAHYEADDYEKAIAAYSSSVEKTKPGDLQEKALYKKGWGHYKLNQVPEAERVFGEQVKLHPKGPLFGDGVFMLAECSFKVAKTGKKDPAKFAKAFSSYEKANTAFAAKPDGVKESIRVMTLLHGAQCLMAQERYTDALKWLEQIPQNYPETTFLEEAYLETGRCKQKEKDADGAVKAYKLAANDAGEIGARATFLIGEVYFGKKEFGAAINEYKKVIYGYGNEPPEGVKQWQVASAYEAGRCYHVQIEGASGTNKVNFVKNAKDFYSNVLKNGPQSVYAKSAKTYLDQLNQLK